MSSVEQGRPEQQQRLNYQEDKYLDGMVRERRWETPEGTKISEGVEKRGYDLITRVSRIEQKPGSQERFIQAVSFPDHKPQGIYPQREYQSGNPYLELEGFTVDEENYLKDSHGRGYHRILYPDGEVTRFHDEQGKPVNKKVLYEETADGWKKTTTTTEIEPISPGSGVGRTKVLNRQEELLQTDQLPPLPKPDKPNGFPSLDAIPAEYYKLPPF